MARPFVLVSAAPGSPTGMSRIATELATRISQMEGIDFLHVGSASWGPLPASGLPVRMHVPWRTWVYPEDAADGSRRAIEAAVVDTWGATTQGVLFVVEDPARAYNTFSAAVGWKHWGYFPIDAHNIHGAIGGPAGRAIQAFDRVLACSPFGSAVIAKTRGSVEQAAPPWIPHGYDPDVFRPTMTADEAQRAQQLLNPTGEDQMVLGCVASNQPRKDWGLFFGTLAELRQRGVNIRGWAHVDREIGEAWSLPQLAADFNLAWKALTVTTKMTDRELAICYARCVATLAIGRGEGFGYPILESLACGTPCFHVNYGGGVDLTPAIMRLGYTAEHLVGPYALRRPILDPHDTAKLIGHALSYMGSPSERSANVAGVAKYSWPAVWPQFESWLRAGLET